MLQYGHVSGSWEFFEEVAAEAAPARWACFHVCVCVCVWVGAKPVSGMHPASPQHGDESERKEKRVS